MSNEKPYQSVIDKIPSLNLEELKEVLQISTNGFQEVLGVIQERAEQIARSPEAVELTNEQILGFSKIFEAVNNRLAELKKA
jgi:predicted nucleotidyltransferase